MDVSLEGSISPHMSTQRFDRTAAESNPMVRKSWFPNFKSPLYCCKIRADVSQRPEETVFLMGNWERASEVYPPKVNTSTSNICPASISSIFLFYKIIHLR
jgi:hypothetical protein